MRFTGRQIHCSRQNAEALCYKIVGNASRRSIVARQAITQVVLQRHCCRHRVQCYAAEPPNDAASPGTSESQRASSTSASDEEDRAVVYEVGRCSLASLSYSLLHAQDCSYTLLQRKASFILSFNVYSSFETQWMDVACSCGQCRLHFPLQNVERAAKMLDEIVEEVFSDLFVSSGVAYVTEEAPDVAPAEVIRAAVMKRIEFMDANFLAAANGYVQAARAAGNEEMAQVGGLDRLQEDGSPPSPLPALCTVCPCNRHAPSCTRHIRFSIRL